MNNRSVFVECKTYTWQNVKKLGNLTLAINLLLYIAGFSIIGTIIEQNRSLQFYINTYSHQNKILGILDWKLILSLQLDHIYTSWWFISLIFVFSSSLIVCTLSKQLPMLKSARKWKFYLNHQRILSFPYTTILVSPSLSILTFTLNKKNYYVFQQNNKIYAYNNLIGRIAPIFVHLSIILLLFGSLVGFFSGTLIQEMIPVGETIHPQNVITSGKISYLKQKFVIYVHKFFIQYNKDNSVQQFISDVSILDSNTTTLNNKVLKVNSPMYFQDMTVYQTDWDVIAIRLQLPENIWIQIPCQLLETKNNKTWVSRLHISANDTISIIVSDLTGKLYIYNNQGHLINVCHVHETITINNVDICFKEILTRTGLQIKTDPGSKFVYLSFGILIISVMLSYTSYSQLWIVHSDKMSYLGGKTNRAYLAFEENLRQLKKSNLHAHKTISEIYRHNS